MADRGALLAGAVVFLASAALWPTASFADGPFLSMLVGGVSTEDVEAGSTDVEFDTGFAFAGQFGYQFDAFRLAGEFGYQLFDGESDADVSSELDVTRFTLNGYLDLPLAPNIGPYIGGGIGVANVRTGDDLSDDFEDEDTAFTWHGEAGLNIGLNPRLSLAPTYRYQWTDTNIGGQSEALKSHIFGVSLRYQFYSGRRSHTHSEPHYDSRGDRYDSGYTSYGSDGRYDDFDHYDRGRHRHDHDRRKRRKTPEEIERNKCGWEGPGCDDEETGS